MLAIAEENVQFFWNTLGTMQSDPLSSALA